MTSSAPPPSGHPSDTRSPPVKPGEELASKYRVERVVGAGAMGVVVEARHVELDQQVAIKFLYPEYARNADGAERFRREARAVVKIKNDHVARVLDVGTLVSKGIPYIVMEYLHGRDLSRELAERGTLPVQEAVSFILQACEAVAEAHRQGIIHRDLKPANLFVAQGPQGQRMIKVLDFGISKVNGQGSKQFSLTDTATLMGSPAYMSPEQLESSRNVDGRSDIWSLGVILHELIIGTVPFTGESVPQLVRAILAGARTTLTERDPELWQLEQVIARCLRQDRNERYQDIEELCAALRPFTDAVSVPLGASSSPAATSRHGSTARGVGGAGSEPRFEQQVEAASAAEPLEGSAAPDESSLGAGGVQSAWGHTQRGRGRPFRRGAPIVAALAVIGGGVYWALMPGFTEAPAPSHLGASTVPLEMPSAQPAKISPAPVSEPPHAPPPAASAPIPPAPNAGGNGNAENQPRVAPIDGAGDERKAEKAASKPEPSARTKAAAPAPAQQPSVRRSPTPTPAPARPAAPAPAADTPAAAPRAASSHAPANDPPPRAAESSGEHDERSKPEPSRREGLDIPDFGGRE